MLLVEFYRGAPDFIRFQEPWNQEHTYLDKLKVSEAHTSSPVQTLPFVKISGSPRRIYPEQLEEK